MKRDANPMHPTAGARFNARRDAGRLQFAPRCLARTRAGHPCQSPAVNGKRRCRMHGGANGSGAPAGNRNGSWQHGGRTREVMELKAEVAEHVRMMRALVATLEG